MLRYLAVLLAFLAGSRAQSEQLKVITKSSPPFTYDQDGEWTGFTFDVINYCIDQKMLTRDDGTSITSLEVKTNDKYKNNDEAFEALNNPNNDFDVYLSNPTMTYAREQVVDFSFPFFKTGLGVAVRAQKEDGAGAKAFFGVFFSESNVLAYVTVFFILFALACIVWVLEMVGNEDVKARKVKYFSTNPVKGIVQAFIWSFRTLVNESYNKKPNHPQSSNLQGLLSVFTIFSMALLTSLLTSAMMAKPESSAIKSPEDLGEEGVVICKYMKSTSAYYVDEQGWGNSVDYDDYDPALEGLQKGECTALIYDKPVLKYSQKLAAKEGDPTKEIETLPIQFEPQEFAFVQKRNGDTTLKDGLNKCALKYAQSANYDAAMKKFINVKEKEGTVDPGAEATATQLIVTIIIAGIFPVIAFLVAKKLKEQEKEKDVQAEFDKARVRSLDHVNTNDLAELIMSMMEGQKDIMDILYRNVTIDETFEEKALSSTELLQKQAKLLQAKEKMLNMRQLSVEDKDRRDSAAASGLSKLKSVAAIASALGKQGKASRSSKVVAGGTFQMRCPKCEVFIEIPMGSDNVQCGACNTIFSAAGDGSSAALV